MRPHPISEDHVNHSYFDSRYDIIYIKRYSSHFLLISLMYTADNITVCMNRMKMSE